MKGRINEDFLELANSKPGYDFWTRRAKTRAKARKRQVQLRVRLGALFLVAILICAPVFAGGQTRTSVLSSDEKVVRGKVFEVESEVAIEEKPEDILPDQNVLVTAQFDDEEEIVADEELETESESETEMMAATEAQTEDQNAPLIEEETEVYYPGVPSDVPEDALSGGITVEENESETEVVESEKETEVLMQLTEVETEEPKVSDYGWDEDKAVALAQLMWGEARGCSKREQSMIAWTVLNRVDAQYSGMTDFWSILTAPDQFYYYPGESYEEYELEIARDVLQRWAAEKDGVVEYPGRTLPEGYFYYYGDGVHNYFSTNGSGGALWFDLGDPYENW